MQRSEFHATSELSPSLGVCGLGGTPDAATREQQWTTKPEGLLRWNVSRKAYGPHKHTLSRFTAIGLASEIQTANDSQRCQKTKLINSRLGA